MNSNPFTTQVRECIEQSGAEGLRVCDLRKLVPHIDHVSAVLSKLFRRGALFRREGLDGYRYFSTKELSEAWVQRPVPVDRASLLSVSQRAQFCPKKTRRSTKIGDGPAEFHTKFKHTVAPSPIGDTRYQVQPGEVVPSTFTRGDPGTFENCYTRSR